MAQKTADGILVILFPADGADKRRFNFTERINSHGYQGQKSCFLNRYFRYQLTCISQFAQAIIAEKIVANQFIIQTDKPNVEVSWMVTGIRHDPAALLSGYKVVQDKEPDNQGIQLVDSMKYKSVIE